MELRVLKYFLAVADEESFTRAAEQLHVTQPTLSRQIQELEYELGKELFVRNRKALTLTPAGALLRNRARDIMQLAGKTEQEIRGVDSVVSGEISIAAGETPAMRLVARAIRRTIDRHPAIKVNIFSGNAEAVAARLDSGVADFGLFIRPVNMENYQFFTIPGKHVWGVLLPKTHALAQKSSITPDELLELPLLCSGQSLVRSQLEGWLKGRAHELNLTGVYNLLYNAALMVEEGVGGAFCLDGIIPVGAESRLCFRPLKPAIQVEIDMGWRKGRIFSAAASAFRAALDEVIDEESEGS